MDTAEDRRRRAGRARPVFARVWAIVGSRAADPATRRELLAGLRGRVLEIGAGSGVNFAYYPPTVAAVVAVEPEPYLRRLATVAAGRAPVAVTVTGGTADATGQSAQTFDAIVCSLVLCSVPDQRAAVRELTRVLALGGQIRLYEHVLSERRAVAAVQRLLDRTGVWPAVAGGCHLARDPRAVLAADGFTVHAPIRRPGGPGRLAVPFVLGTARRHAADR